MCIVVLQVHNIVTDQGHYYILCTIQGILSLSTAHVVNYTHHAICVCGCLRVLELLYCSGSES